MLEPETTRDFIIVREDRNGELTLSIKKIEVRFGPMVGVGEWVRG